MPDTLKTRVVARVMARLREIHRDPGMDRAACETALRRMGMSTGNAQRLLATDVDVQLGRLAEVARLLGVAPSYFLQDAAGIGQPEPMLHHTPTLSEALQVLGGALAQQMPQDVRDDVAHLLARLAERSGLERHQAEIAALLSIAPGKQTRAA
jgi:transcriptional regulator with XRE-family HTH domain